MVSQEGPSEDAVTCDCWGHPHEVGSGLCWSDVKFKPIDNEGESQKPYIGFCPYYPQTSMNECRVGFPIMGEVPCCQILRLVIPVTWFSLAYHPGETFA